MIEDLAEDLSYRLLYIENYKDDEKGYSDLYDSVLNSLEHLTARKEHNGLIGHSICGVIFPFLVDYLTSSGVKTAAVMDFRNLSNENQNIRVYSATYLLGLKSPYTVIRDIGVGKTKIISRRYPFTNWLRNL